MQLAEAPAGQPGLLELGRDVGDGFGDRGAELRRHLLLEGVEVLALGHDVPALLDVERDPEVIGQPIEPEVVRPEAGVDQA